MCTLDDWDGWIEKQLEQLEKAGLKRELRSVTQAIRPICVRNGKRMINLSSSNYLGLAQHPLLLEAMQVGVERGAGLPASRLIIWHEEETERLEADLARWQGMEAALVFGSGYLANLGILSAFLGKKDAVFSDQLNHASIVDGIRLSGAVSFRYRHCDVEHLKKLLQRADEKGYRRKLIVTESVFSMDGDVAPLREIAVLKERYGAALLVDEAHGVGVWGERGTGMVHELGVADQVELHMGTFSKAFGVYGAYVAGKKEWIRYPVQTCRSLIYTTALPPAIISAVHQSLQLIEQADDLRQSLHRKSKWLREQLREAGWNVANSTTQIIPVMVGESTKALAFSQQLSEQGVLAVAIRPPTVPARKARLRLPLMADHSQADLQKVLQVINECGGMG